MEQKFDVYLNENMREFFGSKLSLSEQNDRKAFQEFGAARLSTRTIHACFFCIFILVTYFYIVSLTFATEAHRFRIAIALVFTLLVRTPMFMFIFVMNGRRNNSNVPSYLLNWVPFCESFSIISSTMGLGICLIARVLNGQCSHYDINKSFCCNSEFASQALPQAHLLIIMFYPILHSVVYKAIRVEFIFIAWLVAIVFMISAVVIANATQSIPTLILYVPLSGIILYENYRQDLILYFVVKRQRKLLAENKQLGEDQATELRHMIANVAHDLKTPLSAFMNGVETIAKLLESIDTRRIEFDKIHLRPGLQFEPGADLVHMRENLQNLSSTNDFMLMTINRCIDYTKTSKGLKLDPRLETVRLMDILALPIQVMKDMQSRITVSLQPTPEVICQHIITDKQWLQENLFCLISNAVKYSSNGGSVSVSMSLCASNSLPTGGGVVAALIPPHKKELVSLDPLLIPDALSTGGSTGVTSVTTPIASRKLKSPSQSVDVGFGFGFMFSHANSRIYVAGDDDDSLIPPDTDDFVRPFTPLKVQRAVCDVLLFEVEDTGIGLSDEVMQTLFAPFKQAQRRAGGTGLGLYSLAKRLEALGGFYGVQRRKDGQEGSLFWFAIPYTPDNSMLCLIDSDSVYNTASFKEMSQLNKSTQSKHVSFMRSPTSKLEKLNILLVDDSLTILKMSTMLLRRQGHNVTQAENGAEALKKIAAASSGEEGAVPFDIVLMDFNMPVMDGLEATTRLRALEKQRTESRTGGEPRHQFVVGFSANSDHDTMVEGLTAGMDDFISKPFALQTFYDVYNRQQVAKTKQNDLLK